MTYKVALSKRFIKSYAKLNDKDKQKTQDAIQDICYSLSTGHPLPVAYSCHTLKGSLKGIQDCHIRGDLVLLYSVHNETLQLLLLDIGKHSKLF